MKRTFLSIVLLMLFMGTVQAQITGLAGKDYLELTIEAFDCLDLTGGFVLAIDYETPQSQPLKNLQVDIGDNFIGGYLKFDVSVLAFGPATPYVAYKPMMRNSTISDIYHVLEVGLGIEINKNITAIVAGQFCHQREDDQMFVAGLAIEL